MTGHTPGPWRSWQMAQDEWWWSPIAIGRGDEEDDYVALVGNDHSADAEFIVCACNAHDELLAAFGVVAEDEPGLDVWWIYELVMAAIVKGREQP